MLAFTRKRNQNAFTIAERTIQMQIEKNIHIQNECGEIM